MDGDNNLPRPRVPSMIDTGLPLVLVLSLKQTTIKTWVQPCLNDDPQMCTPFLLWFSVSPNVLFIFITEKNRNKNKQTQFWTASLESILSIPESVKPFPQHYHLKSFLEYHIKGHSRDKDGASASWAWLQNPRWSD